MDPRTRRRFALALVIVIAVTGGAAILLGSRGMAGRVDDMGTSSLSGFIEGVVVRIDSQGLDQVRGFDIRTRDGTIESFVMGELENGAEFPPGHLGEHQATAEPVRVFYREDGATKVAIRIDDAS